jgi:hypothetical protein
MLRWNAGAPLATLGLGTRGFERFAALEHNVMIFQPFSAI